MRKVVVGIAGAARGTELHMGGYDRVRGYVDEMQDFCEAVAYDREAKSNFFSPLINSIPYRIWSTWLKPSQRC